MFRANLSHNGPKPEQGRLGTVNASQKPPMFANPCAKDDQPMRPTGPGRPVLAELAWRRHSQVPSWQLRQHEECCAFRGKDPRLFQCFAIGACNACNRRIGSVQSVYRRIGSCNRQSVYRCVGASQILDATFERSVT